jgi:hypothetical protein
MRINKLKIGKEALENQLKTTTIQDTKNTIEEKI